MRLEGKIAIITGGGSGIGQATAQRFTAEGARLRSQYGTVHGNGTALILLLVANDRLEIQEYTLRLN